MPLAAMPLLNAYCLLLAAYCLLLAAYCLMLTACCLLLSYSPEIWNTEHIKKQEGVT
jgi:hypothetical protein